MVDVGGESWQDEPAEGTNEDRRAHQKMSNYSFLKAPKKNNKKFPQKLTINKQMPTKVRVKASLPPLPASWQISTSDRASSRFVSTSLVEIVLAEVFDHNHVFIKLSF